MRWLEVRRHPLTKQGAARGHALDHHDQARAERLVGTLAALAARGYMRELVVRADLHRSRLGDPTALASARLLAGGIDNRALAWLLDGGRAG
jgi:hypothetical protein